MALWMVAPSIVVMLWLMKGMYPRKTLNLGLIFISVLTFILSFVFIRQQMFVGDAQFLRSMIPHHSGAVLMCENAKITDAEVQQLCKGIVEGQRKEIDQMKLILERLKQ